MECVWGGKKFIRFFISQGENQREKSLRYLCGFEATRIFSSPENPFGTHSVALAERKESKVINQLINRHLFKLMK